MLLQIDLYSTALHRSVPVNVILPQPRSADVPLQPLPALYLLHGMGDNASAWLRKTGIKRYALRHGISVIMPDGGLSCYENMAHGGAYRDFICDELPKRMRQILPLCADRTHNFIAGCSMGGFGALKLGLAHPEIWSGIGCFSAAHFEYRRESPRHQAILRQVYGENLGAYDAQIVADAQAANCGMEKISIWHCCGDQDALRPNAFVSRNFFEVMPAGSIDYHFEMLHGAHDWALWDSAVERYLSYLNLPQPEVQLF